MLVFYFLCKDHGSALLCCRARSHSPEIRGGGCAECVGNVSVFGIRIGKASSGEYQNCCREPFAFFMISVRKRIVRCRPSAPIPELFLNVFFRRIFSAEDFSFMRKNICVSLLFLLWVASPAGRYQTLSLGRRCPFARKKVEYPCLIIGSLLLTDYFIEEIKKLWRCSH